MGSVIIDPVTNKTVFTFFSEFNVEWEGQAPIEVIVLLAIMACAFAGNGMVLMAVKRNPKMRKTTNYFICNLAVADMLFAFWIPFIAVTRVKRQWIFGNIVCKLVTYVQFVSGISSILTLMMISIERYTTVCLLQRKKINNRIAIIVIGVTWVFAVCFPVPIAIVQLERKLTFLYSTFTYCGIIWPADFHTDIYLSFMIIFFFIVPLLVVTVNYYRIFKTVKASARRAAGSQRSEKRTERQLRLNKMFVIIVLAFVVMWLPFFVVSFLAVYLNKITSTQFTITLIIALANTCQNPVIYGYFNMKFRKEFRSMCGCKEKEINKTKKTTQTNSGNMTTNESGYSV